MIAAEPPARVLPAAMLLIALLSESSAGVLLIPSLVAAAGFAVQPRVNVGALPLLLVLLPALFTMASAGMSRAAELRRCLRASAVRGNNILFYLSAAGSLISAYFLLK